MGIRGSVDCGGRSAGEIESSSSSLQPGWFRAKVADVWEEDGTIFLKFDLADGRSLTEKLWNPAASEKPAPLQNRRDSFSIRLGLVPRDTKGVVYDFDWLDAIGRECALELDYSKPNANGQRFVNLTWMGLYALDDQRIPELIRNGAQTAPLGSPSNTTAEEKKKGKSAAKPAGAGATVGAGTGSGSSGSSQSNLNLDDL